jgi:hypothetical protein
MKNAVSAKFLFFSQLQNFEVLSGREIRFMQVFEKLQKIQKNVENCTISILLLKTTKTTKVMQTFTCLGK